MSSGLTGVPLPDLRELLDAVDRGRVQCPLGRGALQAVGLGHLHDRLAFLADLPAVAVGAALRAAIAERTGRPVPRLDLVWTGPEPLASPARDTAVVVRQLFDEAQRSVLVAGFTFDHGADILRHLWLAMRDRGVTARMVLQVDRAGPEGVEARVRSTVDAFVRTNWPFGPPVPELWYDPRTVQPGAVASMHAKCVVVDEDKALVGSANFTDRGQSRNVEVGVLIEDPAFARKLHHQWNGLAAAGLLAKVDPVSAPRSSAGSTPAEVLSQWLAGLEDRLDRFHEPLPVSVVAQETGLDPDAVTAAVRTSVVHHVWSHEYGGKSRPCKPFVLRENGPGTVGLDQEDSVIGAAAAEFRRRGFQTRREFGTPAHMAALSANPDLGGLTPRANQRDLVALRRVETALDLWIVEAKGKEAAEFDYYTVAEALGQLFAVPAEPLSQLFGASRGPGHGKCADIAATLTSAWAARGYTTTVTLALLVPYAVPDLVWKSGKVVRVDAPLYGRPIETLRAFLAGGDSGRSGRFQYHQAYGTILEHLDAAYGVRELARRSDGLRFRLLTASPIVHGLDGAP